MGGKISTEHIVKWLLPTLLLVTFALQVFSILPSESALELSNEPSIFLQYPWTIVSYSFLHSSFLHLGINFVLLVIVLLIDQLSSIEVWGVFLLAVVLSGLLFILLPSDSGASIVGASAGIAALFAVSLCRLVKSRRVGVYLLIAIILIDFLTQGLGVTLGFAMHLTGYLVGVGYYFIGNMKKSGFSDATGSDVETAVLKKARVSGYHSLSSREQEELITSIK